MVELSLTPEQVDDLVECLVFGMHSLRKANKKAARELIRVITKTAAEQQGLHYQLPDFAYAEVGTT